MAECYQGSFDKQDFNRRLGRYGIYGKINAVGLGAVAITVVP
jgi:hypothetical protein